MPDTPLNPDALRVATTAAHDAVDWQMYDVTKSDLEDSVDVATIAAVSAYLAAAQPEVNSVEELAKAWYVGFCKGEQTAFRERPVNPDTINPYKNRETP